MSGRRASSSVSSPNKKLRLESGQSRLDSFFVDSSATLPRSPKKAKAKPKVPPKELKVIDLLDSDSDIPNVASTPSPPKPISGVDNIATRHTNGKSQVIGLCSSVSRKIFPPYGLLTNDPASFVPNPSHFFEGSDGCPIKFTVLAHTLAEIRKTRSRTSIINALTNFFRLVAVHHQPSLVPTIYLLTNTLAPPYRLVELGLGPSAITQAIQHVSGLTSAAFRKLYNELGDPGDVAFEAKSNMRTLLPHAELSILDVYESLLKVSQCSGQGASKQRQRIVEKLLVSSQGEETRFLVRILCQNLRIGAVRTSILTALAHAIVLVPTTSSQRDENYVSTSLLKNVQKGDIQARDQLKTLFKEADSLLRTVFAIHPDYEQLISTVFSFGLSSLEQRVNLTVGIPLQPTLGTPAHSLAEIFERFGDLSFTMEHKYDGQRAQIHVQKEHNQVSVSVFSRHLEDMTEKYPDVVATMREIFSSGDLISVVLDSEIVAINADSGQLKSFQELSGRARRAVNLQDIDVHVSVVAFDIMYFNGRSLLDQDFRLRRSLISKYFPPVKYPDGLAAFTHVTSCDSSEGYAQMERFWGEAVESQSEGVMVKLLDSADDDEKVKRKKKLSARYSVDQRTFSWIKLKKDYVTGIGDTLDLIPIGAWHGNGRKARWWSPVLLALWDPEKERPVAVCKCMSGFSDAFYMELSDKYSLGDLVNCSQQPLWDGDFGGFHPSVYFRPQEVWELRGADLSLSPVSVAAKGLIAHSQKGLSVRFPRFLQKRTDKSTLNATTPASLFQMYQRQPGIARVEAADDDDELGDPLTENSADTESDASI